MTKHRLHHQDAQPRRHHRRYGLAMGVLALGMLFWARILIIADIPRTAIAEDPNATAEYVDPVENSSCEVDSPTDSPMTNPTEDAQESPRF